MYSRGNPLVIAGARGHNHGRKRHRVGNEFARCPDGTPVKFPANSTNCAGHGWPSGDPAPYTPPQGTGGGGLAPGGWGEGGWGGGTKMDPGGSGGDGGLPWNPPGGGSGTPWNPPSGGGGGNPGGTPIPTPGGGGGSGSGGGGIPIPTGCAAPCNICPENLKRYTMPFVPDAGYTATVTAGSQVRFIGKPQKLFKPDRLIIASTIAPYFDIVNLIIANIPQSLSQGNIAADIFSEVSTYTWMTFDQAYPGIDIVIIAQNKSSVTQTFQAALVGEAVG